MKVTWGVVGAASCAAVLGGCGIGYTKMAMATRTNVGINVETTPTPTAEVSISRNEIVVAPTFEAGRAPSALAGFSTKAGTGLFRPSIGSAFAVGDASFALTDLDNKEESYDASMENVRFLNPEDEKKLVPDMQRICPLVFGTDTSTGLKLSWTGTAGQYPDRFHFGYNRKEAALAPLTAQQTKKATDSEWAEYTIDAPSLIATVSVGISAGAGPSQTNFDKVQFFATGEAATRLGRMDQVRSSVFDIVAPGKEIGTIRKYSPAPCLEDFRAWRTQAPGNDIAFRNWLRNDMQYNGRVVDVLYFPGDGSDSDSVETRRIQNAMCQQYEQDRFGVGAPAPTDDDTPAPADDDTPAPADDDTPTPADDDTPAPADDDTPTPADDDAPTPADDDAPAPADDGD